MFPHEITNKEELYKLLWIDENERSIQSSWNFVKEVKERLCKSYTKFVNESYNDVNMTFDEFKNQATDVVFKEIQEQKPNDYLRAVAMLNSDFWMDDYGLLHSWEMMFIKT